MLADDFPRERRANSSKQFHRYSPKSTLTLMNDTPTVRTSRPSTHALNSTATAECCDAGHISEASLPKGQDAASRGQVGAWLAAPGRPGPAPNGHGLQGSARRAEPKRDSRALILTCRFQHPGPMGFLPFRCLSLSSRHWNAASFIILRTGRVLARPANRSHSAASRRHSSREFTYNSHCPSEFTQQK
jgi:hypothetical protein